MDNKESVVSLVHSPVNKVQFLLSRSARLRLCAVRSGVWRVAVSLVDSSMARESAFPSASGCLGFARWLPHVASTEAENLHTVQIYCFVAVILGYIEEVLFASPGLAEHFALTA